MCLRPQPAQDERESARSEGRHAGAFEPPFGKLMTKSPKRNQSQGRLFVGLPGLARYNICCTKGISLVAVVIVMLIVSTLALLMASFMSSGNISAITDMQAEQAFYIANAGMECYLELLQADSDWSIPPTVFTNQAFGSGTFTITYANQAVSAIDVTSTGKVTGWDGNSVQRVIVQHVTKTGGSGYPGGVPQAFTYGIHCFTNDVNFKKSDGTVNGNVASTSEVKNHGSMTINGNVIEYSTVPDPGPVTMASYLAIANVVQSGNYTFTTGTYGSSGNEQIYYINGAATINSNVTIYGTVIATGNININNRTNIHITSATGYPAFIAGYDISITTLLSNSTIDGLIYADHNLTLDHLDNVTMNTCILAGNSMSIQTGSNFTINYSSSIYANPPPYFSGYSSGSATVTTSLWQEIL